MVRWGPPTGPASPASYYTYLATAPPPMNAVFSKLFWNLWPQLSSHWPTHLQKMQPRLEQEPRLGGGGVVGEAVADDWVPRAPHKLWLAAQKAQLPSTCTPARAKQRPEPSPSASRVQSFLLSQLYKGKWGLQHCFTGKSPK